MAASHDSRNLKLIYTDESSDVVTGIDPSATVKNMADFMGAYASLQTKTLAKKKFVDKYTLPNE